jgi:protein-disulfide isomerase
MQNFSQQPKSKFTVKKIVLSILGIIILILLVSFMREVMSVRNQILSGEYNYNEFGVLTSGTGGANLGTGEYDVATSDDPTLGSQDALVTIVEFSDFECPFCRQSFPIIRSLVEEFKENVRYVYRDFPLESIHPNARLAAKAGYCAHQQNLFWPLHDKLFQNQNNLSRTDLVSYAQQVGLNQQEFLTCLDSKAADDEINLDITEGQAAGALGTPTWFINGNRVAGVIPEQVFREIINTVIASEEKQSR